MFGKDKNTEIEAINTVLRLNVFCANPLTEIKRKIRENS
jgi:hypothetical protein